METKQPDRLYRRVADQIIAEIRTGIYKTGDKLPAERELAETFGVSRPSVREAIMALEIMGIVEIRGRLGIYVIGSSESLANEDAFVSLIRSDLNVGAFELVEARILFEGETAGLAAHLVKPRDIEVLNGLIDEMRTSDAAGCENADRAFHIHIAAITNNGALVDTIEHLWNLRTQSPLAAQIMTRAQGGGRAARIAEHEAIVKALASRNSNASRIAMQAHLEQVREYLLDATETAEINDLRLKLQMRRRAVIDRTKPSD